jgi:peptide/nickel transport system substrate-binding protein
MVRGSRLKAIFVSAVVILATSCAGGNNTSNSNFNPTLNLAYPGGWQTLDPAVAFANENDALAQVYETLTLYDYDSGKVVPALATSWEHNTDGTVWTFHLRPNVKFQDGSDWNADAVKFSIERIKKINKGAAYLWAPVKSVDVVDPLTARLNLSSAAPMDLVAAASWCAFMMSPKSDDQPSSWFDAGRGVGTGPYKWQSYSATQSAVLTKFDGYWGGWKSNQFTKIFYNISSEATTRQQQLLSGTSQVAGYLGLQAIKGLAGNSKIKIHSLNVGGIYYIGLNTSKPPLTDVRVRQAIAYSFPQEQIVKTIYGDFAKQESTSFIPNGMWGHAKLKGYTYDLDKAKSLLAAAGHPNGGFSVQFVWVQFYPQDEQLAELWKPELAKLGITMNISQISVDAWLKDCCSVPGTGPEIMTENWPPTYPSPYDYLFSTFGTGGPGGVGTYYHTAQDDALMAKGLVQSATDQQAAIETFTTVQQHIFDAAAAIPVVDYPQNWAANSNIDGFTQRASALWMYGLHGT